MKDYPPQQIINMNDAQIARLSPLELDAISGELKPHAELLEFFRYSLR